MDVVYATGSSVVALAGGGQVMVQAGSHWPANDPVVRSCPSLFSADPRTGLSFTAPPTDEPESSRVVEQATAAPGERRRTVHRG